jgi:hypothetical protein
MEIIFVTGKGGVGKSAVAAALALQKAQSGRKTLLVELGRESFYQNSLHLPQLDAQATYHGVPWPGVPKLTLALWSGPECLKEYALYLLKIESLYRLFFENPVTRTLVQVAPALPELSIMGKATSGPRRVGPPLNYDTIVIDAFATGHFMALLRAPQGMAEAVRFGPMGEQSRSINRTLSNPDFCKYVVVAFPEELPVIEGLELAHDIEKVVGIKPTLVMNRWQDLSGSILTEHPLEEHLMRFQRHLQRVDQRQQELLATVKEKFSPILLPQIFEVDFLKVVDVLTKALSEVKI